MANVSITSEAQRQFNALPTAIRNRIEKLFVRLEQWPSVSGAKALSGNLAGRYRIRTGDYRVQFHVIRSADGQGKAALERVIIEKVGHRDGFYEE